jgi:hypothetical protein
MAIECEIAVKGDSKGFYLVREWNHNDADAWEWQTIVAFKPSVNGDGFRFITSSARPL